MKPNGLRVVNDDLRRKYYPVWQEVGMLYQKCVHPHFSLQGQQEWLAYLLKSQQYYRLTLNEESVSRTAREIERACKLIREYSQSRLTLLAMGED
jgi:hypothetical protein